MCVGRETDRQTDRDTDRQTDRQTETDRQTDRQRQETGRQTETERWRETERQTAARRRERWFLGRSGYFRRDVYSEGQRFFLCSLRDLHWQAWSALCCCCAQVPWIQELSPRRHIATADYPGLEAATGYLHCCL